MVVVAGSFPWCPYYTHDLFEALRPALPAHKTCAGEQAVRVTSKVALVSHVRPPPTDSLFTMNLTLSSLVPE